MMMCPYQADKYTFRPLLPTGLGSFINDEGFAPRAAKTANFKCTSVTVEVVLVAISYPSTTMMKLLYIVLFLSARILCGNTHSGASTSTNPTGKSQTFSIAVALRATYPEPKMNFGFTCVDHNSDMCCELRILAKLRKTFPLSTDVIDKLNFESYDAVDIWNDEVHTSASTSGVYTQHIRVPRELSFKCRVIYGNGPDDFVEMDWIEFHMLCAAPDGAHTFKLGQRTGPGEDRIGKCAYYDISQRQFQYYHHRPREPSVTTDRRRPRNQNPNQVGVVNVNINANINPVAQVAPENLQRQVSIAIGGPSDYACMDYSSGSD